MLDGFYVFNSIISKSFIDLDENMEMQIPSHVLNALVLQLKKQLLKVVLKRKNVPETILMKLTSNLVIWQLKNMMDGTHLLILIENILINLQQRLEKSLNQNKLLGTGNLNESKIVFVATKMEISRSVKFVPIIKRTNAYVITNRQSIVENVIMLPTWMMIVGSVAIVLSN